LLYSVEVEELPAAAAAAAMTAAAAAATAVAMAASFRRHISSAGNGNLKARKFPRARLDDPKAVLFFLISFLSYEHPAPDPVSRSDYRVACMPRPSRAAYAVHIIFGVIRQVRSLAPALFLHVYPSGGNVRWPQVILYLPVLKPSSASFFEKRLLSACISATRWFMARTSLGSFRSPSFSVLVNIKNGPGIFFKKFFPAVLVLYSEFTTNISGIFPSTMVPVGAISVDKEVSCGMKL